MTYVNRYSCVKYKYTYKYSDLKYKYKYKYPSLKYKYKYFKIVLEHKYKYQVLQVCRQVMITGLMVVTSLLFDTCCTRLASPWKGTSMMEVCSVSPSSQACPFRVYVAAD